MIVLWWGHPCLFRIEAFTLKEQSHTYYSTTRDLHFIASFRFNSG